MQVCRTRFGLFPGPCSCALAPALSVAVLCSVVPSALAGGNLIVLACDALAITGCAPPEAVAVLDGGYTSKAFNGALSIEFLNVPSGIHTLEVTAAYGYLPGEDPNQPGQITNPDSAFGNPRKVEIANNEWTAEGFEFGPFFSACGVARDAWTMERIQNAKIEFIARSGWITNEVYDGYPNYAAYESHWYTEANGLFPTNVFLPTVCWDLRLSQTNYTVLVVSNAVTDCAPGDKCDLGTFLITPVDVNSNGLADAWETTSFGYLGVDPCADADGDGHNNWEEYYIGTDPTNPTSCLVLDVSRVEGVTGAVRVTWSTANWRTYSLLANDYLCPTCAWWQVTNVTWEATNGQTSLSWEDFNPMYNSTGEYVTYYYNLQVVAWDYVGSTQRYYHPPQYTSGGSGTNSPDDPPLP